VRKWVLLWWRDGQAGTRPVQHVADKDGETIATPRIPETLPRTVGGDVGSAPPTRTPDRVELLPSADQDQAPEIA
jgi:hypothetical protein